MWKGKDEVLFDLVTRDALLVWNGQIIKLDGPFPSLEDARRAADEFKSRVSDTSSAA